MTKQPYATAPKDGQLVILSAGDLRDSLPMRWDADAAGPLISDSPGHWVTLNRNMTWSDRDPRYAPTHWEELPDRPTRVGGGAQS